MSANVLAMTNNINDYPEKVSDIVDTLIHLLNSNETREPANDQLREWIEDRLTMLANFSHIDPKIAERLYSETRMRVDTLLQEPRKAPKFRPKLINTLNI